MDAVNDLRNLLHGGLAEDIRQIEESLILLQEIRASANGINASELGPLFGRLELICGRHAVITTIRLFEPPDDRYPSRSIPTILNHMRFTADYLTIDNRGFILERLINFGHETGQFEGIPDQWITQLVRKEFHDRLPNANEPELNELSRALDSLNRLKDKPVAHSEEVQSDDEWKANTREIRTLLDYATDFAITLGKGYLNQNYVIDKDTSIFQLDADRTMEIMKKLLIIAGI